MPDSPAPPDSGANASDIVLEVDRLSLYYGASRALDAISLRIPRKRITAFIGPSGCGKSTLLRCCNRMNDLVDGVRTEGDVRFDGVSILGPDVEAGQHPQALVPAGTWQAAAPSTDAEVLVSCIVSPGFSFADFTLDD